MPAPFELVANSADLLQVAVRVGNENPCASCLESRLQAVPLPNNFSRAPDRVNAELQTGKRLHAINPLPAVFPGVGGFAVGVLGGHTQRRSTSKNSSPNCSTPSRNSANTTATRQPTDWTSRPFRRPQIVQSRQRNLTPFTKGLQLLKSRTVVNGIEDGFQ